MNPSIYSTISFPFLGIEVNPGRTLSLGPLTIHYYGLVIAVGLMLAVEFNADETGYEFSKHALIVIGCDHILDPCGVIGGGSAGRCAVDHPLRHRLRPYLLLRVLLGYVPG